MFTNTTHQLLLDLIFKYIYITLVVFLQDSIYISFMNLFLCLFILDLYFSNTILFKYLLFLNNERGAQMLWPIVTILLMLYY